MRQRLRVLEAGIRVEVGIEEAIRILALKARTDGDDVDDDRLRDSIGRLNDAWLMVHADLVSYVGGDLPVRPPENADARQIDERSGLLLSLTQDAPPSIVLTLVRDLIDQWSATRMVGTLATNGNGRGRARGRGLPVHLARFPGRP